MPKLTDKTVKEFARKYGIEFAKLGTLGWVARFEGEEEDIKVGLNEADETVIFAVYPLLTVKCRKCRPKLYEHLLLLNAEGHLFRYGVDADSNIQLTVHFPSGEFTYAQFAAALDAIKGTVEAHLDGIKKLARD